MDTSGSSEFGPELSNHKVSCKEKDAVRDGDAKILGYRSENGGLGCAKHRTCTYPPHMRPLVVEAKLKVLETVDRGLSGHGTNDCASPIVHCDVLVAKFTGNKV